MAHHRARGHGWCNGCASDCAARHQPSGLHARVASPDRRGERTECRAARTLRLYRRSHSERRVAADGGALRTAGLLAPLAARTLWQCRRGRALGVSWTHASIQGIVTALRLSIIGVVGVLLGSALWRPMTMHRAANSTVLAAERPISIIGATVIPMTAGRGIKARDAKRLSNYTVLIRGERIVALGPSDSLIVPNDAVRIDGRGRFVLPGLVNAHIHLSVRRAFSFVGLAWKAMMP